MKKCFALAVTAIVFASAAQATPKKEYVPGDTSLASSLCAIAGNQGTAAAKTYARQKGVSYDWIASTTSCNGTPLAALAEQAKTTTSAMEPVEVVATIDNEETQLCIEALRLERGDPALKYEPYKDLACNGKPVASFLRDVYKAQR